jgi:hypothetical protein
MQLARSVIATDPRRFGRGRPRLPAAAQAAVSLSDDAKLFGTTFLAGFVFVSLFLA